jgi:hypothetical protein
VAYINGVFYASVGDDMHQPKFNASVEVKNTNGISGGERIKGRYDVTIGRGLHSCKLWNVTIKGDIFEN